MRSTSPAREALPVQSRAPRTGDRRVQRTLRALRDSLLWLLSNRTWDEIDVQDICARADIGRSTFYTHFQNKEELLVGGLSDLRDALRAHAQRAANQRGTLDRLWYVRGLIDHAHEQRTVFRAIIGNRSGHVVQQRFTEMTRQLVSEDFSPHGAASWQQEATTHHVTGALVAMLQWSVDSPHRVSPAELEAYFRRLVRPVMDEMGEAADRSRTAQP